MIENYYKTPFFVSTRTTTKTDGRLLYTYEAKAPGLCAIFTPNIQKIIRVGKQDFLVDATIYCPVSTVITLGDRVTIASKIYDVIAIFNSNNFNHHLKVSLVSVA